MYSNIDKTVARRLYFLLRIIALQELGRLCRKENDLLNQRLIAFKIFFLQEKIEEVNSVLDKVYNVDIRRKLDKNKRYLLKMADREIFTKQEYQSCCKLIGEVDDVIDRLIVKYNAINNRKFNYFNPDRRIW